MRRLVGVVIATLLLGASIPASAWGLTLGDLPAVLPLVNCRLGKVRKMASKRIPKGAVLSTSPGAGTTAPGTTVTVTVSSGKPRKKAGKHHH